MEKDINIGEKINDLTIIKTGIVKKFGKQYRAAVLCKCSCGKEVILSKTRVKNGHVKSCGHRRSRYGGRSRTRLHNIWKKIKQRTGDHNDPSYPRYGGRGIYLSKEWNDFIIFENDMKQSYIQHLQEYGEINTTIDRIDNSMGYSKENCRWATRKEQARNMRSNRFIEYNGEKASIAEIAEKYGIKYQLLRDRINRGWNIQSAIEIKKLGTGKKLPKNFQERTSQRVNGKR